MKKNRYLFILPLLLFCTVLYLQTTTYAAEDSTITVTNDGCYTYTDKLNDSDEIKITIIKSTQSDNPLLRATKTKTGNAGVIVTLSSDGTKVADISAEGNFKYDGTYVWGTSGTLHTNYLRSGYTRSITKNTYSSAKTTSKSTYYTTTKIYKGSTLFDTVKINLSCSPSGSLSVTY